MMRYVNVCDDGRGGYHFGPLWPSQGQAREEACYLIPAPIAIGVPIEVSHPLLRGATSRVNSAIRALQRVGECA